MIPLPGIRAKGSGPQLGAKGPHQRGPFGVRPGEDDLDEDDVDGGLDDEQHDHRASVRTTDGSAADNPSAANDNIEGAAP